MRISSQNSQFIFNLPVTFLAEEKYDQFEKLMIKNFVPYDSALDYLSSTIKDIVIPNLAFDNSEQVKKYGKKVYWKETGMIWDKFTPEVDITFRSVDSHLNYFMLLEILVEAYLNTRKYWVDMFNISILDKDGNLIYTILFREILLKSISELRLAYNIQDLSEKTFTITFSFNWIDINWELTDTGIAKSIYDVPVYF